MLKEILDAVLQKGIKINFKICGGKKKKVESADEKVNKAIDKFREDQDKCQKIKKG